MKQQINLYQSAIFEQKATCSLRTIAMTLLAVLVLMSGVGVGGQSYLGYLSRRLEKLHGEEAALQARWDQFQRAAAPASLLLAQEVTRLRQERDQRQALLSGMDRLPPSEASGFFPLMAGLARQTVPGLWLRRIAVRQGGKGLVLEGCAGHPEDVPKLVQKLAAEPAFAGIEFARMQLQENAENEKVIDFLLAADERNQP